MQYDTVKVYTTSGLKDITSDIFDKTFYICKPVHNILYGYKIGRFSLYIRKIIDADESEFYIYLPQLKCAVSITEHLLKKWKHTDLQERLYLDELLECHSDSFMYNKLVHDQVEYI
jgi:hypothetical protein